MKLVTSSFSITAVPQAVLVLAIRLYQKTHLFRSPSCRFYPTCSEYMAGSVTRFGVVKGAALGLLRLCKCHPWNDGGVDMVPARQNFSEMSKASNTACITECRGNT